MRKLLHVLLGSFFMFFLLFPATTLAQRRARPGSMKHTQAEVVEKQKVTTLSSKSIRDGAVFFGPVYMTGDNGAIKIGDAIIEFDGGRYKINFDAAKFKIRKYPTMTEKQRLQQGISDYEYNKWEYKKLGEDFKYGGKYTVMQQYGKTWLILYNGNSNDVYAKIPLNSPDDKSFELNEDDMLVKMSLLE